MMGNCLGHHPQSIIHHPFNKMGNIYLVGFMGTGKTSVGRELAAEKKWQFADLDELIELQEKRSVADIFAKDGEAYFRKVESSVLKKSARQEKFVFACGGGIVLDPVNIKIMKQTGTLICLSADPKVILKRTAGYAHRPLLNVKDPAAQIEHLLRLRSPYYAQANKNIDTSKLTVKQVVARIIKLTPMSMRKAKI